MVSAKAPWRLFYSAARVAYATLIDALFPLSPAEAALAKLTPEEALSALPPAPAYDGSVVALPDARSVFAYQDERVSRLIWCVKYKKSAHAVRLAGYALWQELVAAFPATGSSPAAILVPIPITRKRRRERGYNQCELLIDEVLQLDRLDRSGRLDATGRFADGKDILMRTQNSVAQKTKDRQARLAEAKGIFAINKEIQHKYTLDKSIPIIVIDDVITTGSTMKEATDVLRAAGFAEVRGLSVAH